MDGWTCAMKQISLSVRRERRDTQTKTFLATDTLSVQKDDKRDDKDVAKFMEEVQRIFCVYVNRCVNVLTNAAAAF